MTEKELAKCVVNHYTDAGYEVYQEVKASSRRLIDIVVKGKNGSLTSIETKLVFNIKLIEQAYVNQDFCNRSLIVVPENVYRRTRTGMITTMLESLNIGLCIITYEGKLKNVISCNKMPTRKLLRLFEEQKTFAEAGSPGTRIFTPFKYTLKLIREHLEEHGEKNLYDLMASIPHHYKTLPSAVNSIRKYAKKGVLEDIKLSEDGHRLYISKP